jgi:hypothetical protein
VDNVLADQKRVKSRTESIMLFLPVEVGHCNSTILCADIGDVRADWSIGQIKVGVHKWELR